MRMYLLLLILETILRDLLEETDRTNPKRFVGTEGSYPIC